MRNRFFFVVHDQADSKRVMVNLDHISAVYELRTGCQIYFQDSEHYVTCTESYNEVSRVIDAACQKGDKQENNEI